MGKEAVWVGAAVYLYEYSYTVSLRIQPSNSAFTLENIEWFIEEQAFSRSYDVAPCGPQLSTRNWTKIYEEKNFSYKEKGRRR